MEYHCGADLAWEPESWRREVAADCRRLVKKHFSVDDGDKQLEHTAGNCRLKQAYVIQE